MDTNKVQPVNYAYWNDLENVQEIYAHELEKDLDGSEASSLDGFVRIIPQFKIIEVRHLKEKLENDRCT